jgi:hypothetical protein
MSEHSAQKTAARRSWPWALLLVAITTAFALGWQQATHRARATERPLSMPRGEPHAALPSHASPEQRLRELSRQLQLAKAQEQSLRQELAALQQNLKLDREICQAVRESVNKLDDETASLRQQLAYYKGLSAPQDARAGVRVQSLKIFTGADVLRYELVLMQSNRAEERIAGTAEIQVVGHRGDTPVSLPLSSLVQQGDRDWVFSFKYFDEFSGSFKLPEQFTPEKLVVSLKAVNDRPMASEEFPWVMLAAQAPSQEPAVEPRSSDAPD